MINFLSTYVWPHADLINNCVCWGLVAACVIGLVVGTIKYGKDWAF
jgi:hypothetical protein